MRHHAYRYSRLFLMLVIMLSILTVTASATTVAVPAATTSAKGRTATAPTKPTPSPSASATPSAPQGAALAPTMTPDDPYRYAPDAAVPLIPDGNLTLQDDLQNTVSGDLQFLTVRTKAGNTFYLVIDRAAKENNVHFLNLVDEADLLALLKKEAGVTSFDGFGASTGIDGDSDGDGTPEGGFSLQWPSSESGEQTASANAHAPGAAVTSGSQAHSSAASPTTGTTVSEPGTAHASESGTPSPDASASAPVESFASKMKAYASLGFLLLLLIGGGVFWLVRTLRKRKMLRAKHPTDEYLYVEEPDVPDLVGRDEEPSRQNTLNELDEDGEDLI